MFSTYIIYSESRNKYYVGSTADLYSRLNDHNNSRSKFTSTGKPWVLVWSREFESRQLAVQEEMRIKKKKSRKYIEHLICEG